MKIGLIDVDSKLPNLALMKISSWHKSHGDDVSMYSPLFSDPDICYASKIFDFTPDYQYFPACKTYRGGTGYDITTRLPFPDDDRIMPDYSLYHCTFALGRFTRGCPNRCPWCLVPKMDGTDVRHVADLKDFWAGQPLVRLLDDNIMIDEDLFIDACRQLHDSRVKVRWEALDIRRVNKRTADALASLKRVKDDVLHFSWDGHGQDDAVVRGIHLLDSAGIRPRYLMFYVLIGFNTSREYDMYRIQTLRSLGAYPFVMPYDKRDPYQRNLARWSNNKALLKSVPWEEYKPNLRMNA